MALGRLLHLHLLAITVNATIGNATSTIEGALFLSAPPTVFTYDDDGNLLTDGIWNYGYDGENRLVAIEAVDVGAFPYRWYLTYDYQGRRVRQVGNMWTPAYEEEPVHWSGDSDWVYVYDGFHLLGTFNYEYVEDPWELFVWGLDVSGTRGGAGGVGGLLMAFLPPMDYEDPPPEEERRVFYGYDANGNVVDLIHNTTGDWRGGYEYDAFGRTVHIRGGDTARWHNPIRFSTKYLIASEEGYQMIRWYDHTLRIYYPDLARFTTQDPLNEPGAKLLRREYGKPMNLAEECNLYGFIKNDAVGSVSF